MFWVGFLFKEICTSLVMKYWKNVNLSSTLLMPQKEHYCILNIDIVVDFAKCQLMSKRKVVCRSRGLKQQYMSGKLFVRLLLLLHIIASFSIILLHRRRKKRGFQLLLSALCLLPSHERFAENIFNVNDNKKKDVSWQWHRPIHGFIISLHFES